MQFRNSHFTFGVISIALHWLGALAVVVLLSSALMMATASGRDAYLPWVKFHSSVGILVLLLLAARILWHFVAHQPAKLSDSHTLNRVASVVHTALLVLIGLQLVTGPIDIWTGGFVLRVFDWFVVPSLIGDAFSAQHDSIGIFHRYVGLTIGILVTLHIAAVMKHMFYDCDDTFARMVGLTENPAAPQSDNAEPGTQMP